MAYGTFKDLVQHCMHLLCMGKGVGRCTISSEGDGNAFRCRTTRVKQNVAGFMDGLHKQGGQVLTSSMTTK